MPSQQSQRMWIPPRPNDTRRGDQYSNKQRRHNNRPSYPSFNQYHHRRNNNNNNNQYQAQNNMNGYKQIFPPPLATQPELKPVPPPAIISKKRNQHNIAVNDSFISDTSLNAKRRQNHENFIKSQRQNSDASKLQKQRNREVQYTQIKAKYGLPSSSNGLQPSPIQYQMETNNQTQNFVNNQNAQTRTQTNNAYNNTKPKLLRKQIKFGRTKFAILDLLGTRNEIELFSELDSKYRASLNLKPKRPPIRQSQQMDVHVSTPTSNKSNSSFSQWLKDSIRPTPTSSVSTQTQLHNNASPQMVIAQTQSIQTELTHPIKSSPVVRPKVSFPSIDQPMPMSIDSEQLEQEQREKQHQKHVQFKGTFVAHSDDKTNTTDNGTTVESITNDVRKLNVTQNEEPENETNGYSHSQSHSQSHSDEHSLYTDIQKSGKYQTRNGNKNRNQKRMKRNESYDNSHDYGDEYVEPYDDGYYDANYHKGSNEYQFDQKRQKYQNNRKRNRVSNNRSRDDEYYYDEDGGYYDEHGYYQQDDGYYHNQQQHPRQQRQRQKSNNNNNGNAPPHKNRNRNPLGNGNKRRNSNRSNKNDNRNGYKQQSPSKQRNSKNKQQSGRGRKSQNNRNNKRNDSRYYNSRNEQKY